jgi:MYXO-CTERM domain-containing protein
MNAKWGCVLAGLVTACSNGPTDPPIGATSEAVTSPAPVDAPAIDWSSIGQTAPTAISIGARAPTDPLPQADVVVVTWTAAEWSALDHVFLNSGSSRSATDNTFRSSWPPYTRDASQFTSGGGGALWGNFQLVQITDDAGTPWRVLLFKSNAHLTFSPYLAGLRAMVQDILTDTGCKRIYSIGTAGAARLDQKLGDSVVTNAAYLEMTVTENASDPANGQTFTSPSYPSLDLESSAQTLMIPLGTAATSQDLQSLFTSVFSGSPSIASTDVINAPLQNLGVAAVHSMQGVALNTSDDFLTTPGAGMAPGDGNDPYSVYETDDAVIAQAAIQANVAYASIRNVSDTVVPSTTASAAPISDTLRTNWSSALYYRYGFLTAVNGAIATWAAIASSGTPTADGGAPGDDAGTPGADAGTGSGGSGGSSGGCALTSVPPTDAAPFALALVALTALGARRRRR